MNASPSHRPRVLDIVFWPTRFRRDLAKSGAALTYRPGDRPRYLLTVAALLLALPSVVTWLVVSQAETFFQALVWQRVWMGVALGITSGALIGAARGMARLVAIGVAAGVATGVLLGPTVGCWLAPLVDGLMRGQMTLPGDLLLQISIGVSVGLALGVLGALADGIEPGLGGGLALGVAYGGTYGLALGISLSTWAGLTAALILPFVYWMTYFRLPFYPVDAALSALAYLVCWARPDLVARAWSWSPVAWNEVIWLPLPFVTQTLALLVQHDRRQGYEKIAFVAQERRLQRPAAIAALAEVALDDLRVESFPEMAEVAGRLGWTASKPATLPPELERSIDLFDSVSQLVRQHGAIQSHYRKSETVTLAIARLEDLRRELVTSQGRLRLDCWA